MGRKIEDDEEVSISMMGIFKVGMVEKEVEF